MFIPFLSLASGIARTQEASNCPIHVWTGYPTTCGIVRKKAEPRALNFRLVFQPGGGPELKQARRVAIFLRTWTFYSLPLCSQIARYVMFWIIHSTKSSYIPSISRRASPVWTCVRQYQENAMNRAFLERHLQRLILRYSSEKGRSLRFLLIAALVPTILALDLVLGRISLGLLYIIPMVLASVSMREGKIAMLALLCAIFSWWGDTSASRIDRALYFIFSFISYVCVAYFVTTLLHSHRMAIDNLNSVEEERALRREVEERAKNRQMELSGMLINAQEKERSRLASEIHDDFSQRLALIALDLENAEEIIGISPDEAVQQLHRVMNSASEIGADLHTLSHRLHSSTLERLGLVPGVTSLCNEFAVQQKTEIDFLTDDVPRSVHPDVSLCLFRIVQEGLRNLKKHSGAAKAQVRLRRVSDKLLVSVSDEGVGFDLHDLGKKEGLGIRSMEERAHLLGGRFEIYSKPGEGTRIEASVPLHPK